MDLYDGIITRTGALLSQRPFQRWDYDPRAAWEDAGQSELVLGRDSAYELGGSGTFAVHYTCVTGNPAPAGRDEILLYGPDLAELREDTPYARLSFLSIADPGGDDETLYRIIRDIEFVKYHVFPRGFMLRISSTDQREQVRLSREAIRKGISFKAVGFDFIKKYRENPLVRHVQMLFITDTSIDYRSLERNAKAAADITGALTHIMEGIALDCASCSLKPVCDEVEGMRELHRRRN
jgi:CO dehydrogenase/acetyl-CoA synthase beta subunit